MAEGSYLPILWRPPILPTPIFQILSNPPCRCQTAPPLFFLLSCFFDQIGDWATFDVLFCLIMILWIHTCQTLVSQYQDLDVGFMQQGIKNTHTPVDWHTHINTYLHHVLCAHSSYLYCTEWIINWYQKFTFHNVFSFQNLFTCKNHVSVY